MSMHSIVTAPISGFRVLALSAGLAMIAILATLAQTGNAQAASGLSQCTGSSKQGVVDCCNKYVAEHPQFWMRQSHTSCSKAVGCSSSRISFTSAKLVKRCFVQQPLKEMNGKEQESKSTFSDIRLKANIHRIGTTVLNLPLYSFQYLNQTGTYVGVMAQDVLKVEPSAVSVGANGYYMVDYGKLGIAMERIQ
ncbi:MAG: tail fiber domain-containing protein [Aestuariivirga sp.]